MRAQRSLLNRNNAPNKEGWYHKGRHVCGDAPKRVSDGVRDRVQSKDDDDNSCWNQVANIRAEKKEKTDRNKNMGQSVMRVRGWR